ncbi:ATP-dependent DNA helicase RecQ [Ureibacillus xyleni]|uniref:DNA 3'-5' helicase n=1 Tax=Ureibacillus xyleni TaxID=614648 RepID=A0A285TNA1_9BACL|nr:helicase-related protein [Ureibacillus xyleni]SOC24061.1 ATP-dependent DNA helicase RecQ [Ureibacillus xyleni]
MYENEHLNRILKQENFTIKTLLVLKGFSTKSLRTIDVPKLFDNEIGSNLVDLEKNKQNLILAAITKLSLPETVFWCTYEELLTVSKASIENFYNIKIYYNNLFCNYFPLSYHIDNLPSIYDQYFENIEDHYNIPEEVELITKFYGNIMKVDQHNFYVSYVQKEDDELEFYSYDTLTTKFPITTSYETFIEISEDEEEFIHQTEELLEDKTKNEINITWKGDLGQFSHRYIERMAVLQTIIPSLKIQQIQQSIEITQIEKEGEYIDILQRYWGYNSFRPLKMYKNVDNFENPKEITNIPQSQIINDLVTQAELATSGQKYRDIFVTSSTGAGKSIMFQVPAVYLAEQHDLLTIVISPLIGLMKDQVYSLQDKKVNFSATINSEISPVEKMNIVNRVQSGEISILYISPETLLSRSDIKMLIGERKVGLFIIDEAHIVTTWGKAFRSDYWYLGNYIQKLRKEMKFPIATFTATAIYGGVEDMYKETRDSLHMVNPINYFGYVKRDDLSVSLKKIDSDHISRDREYLATKYELLHERLKRFNKKGKKVLVYFPFVKFINEFYEYLELHATETLLSSTSKYYGSMKKEEKNQSFLLFKNGDSLVMLATKAFGMGIDIPDIDHVIHFAPTGNVCDYIQEIGRAARAEDLQGKAYFDFLSKDFNHVKRLHGISTIKKTQLIQVMDKILSIYSKGKNKKYARNLLISSEDFRYIFERSNKSDFENDDLDNKLKTALLIIEKDFINKLGYSPIIARPRSIFSSEFVKVKRDIENDFAKTYSKYVKKVKSVDENYFGGIYKLDLKLLWEDKFKDISFPQFKYQFHQKDDSLKLRYIEFIESVFILNLDLLNKKEFTFLNDVHKFVEQLQSILSKFVRMETFFTQEQFAVELQKVVSKSKYEAESLANQILQSLFSYQDALKKTRTQRVNIITVREKGDVAKYKLFIGANDFINFMTNHIDKLIKISETNLEGKYELFLTKSSKLEVEKTFIALGLLESLDLLLYEVRGGDNPEIFIRVNSKLQIEKAILNAEKYHNTILSNVYNRHQISVAMLTFLFERQVETEEFWEYIEDYFLGRIPNEVLEKSAK